MPRRRSLAENTHDRWLDRRGSVYKVALTFHVANP